MTSSAPPQLPDTRQPSQNELNLAMWCHLIPILTGLVGLGIVAFVGPLVILNTNTQRSSYVDFHAKESLNFQLSFLIYGAVLTIFVIIVAVLTLGFGLILLIPIILGVSILALVLEILATIASTRGELHRYPLTIRFLK